MNSQQSSLQPTLPLEDSMLASDRVDGRVQPAVLCQRQEKRLARLFTHAGDNADGCYLRDLMTRYRELMSS